MHYYMIEPDDVQAVTPVHYYGNFFNRIQFMEKHGGTYIGDYRGNEIIHMVGNDGEINIIQGSQEAPVFEYEEGLAQARRLQEEGQDAQVIVWKERVKEMLHVTSMGIIRRSV